MSNASKILVTVIVIVVFIILFAIVVGVRGDAGAHGPGIIGLLLFAAVVGAVRAIWSKKDRGDENNDGMLQR